MLLPIPLPACLAGMCAGGLFDASMVVHDHIMRGKIDKGGPVGPYWENVTYTACDYAVDQQPATLLMGKIPKWVRGSYYHAIFATKVATLPMPPFKTPETFQPLLGAVMAAHFHPQHDGPTASFGFIRGSMWHRFCFGHANDADAPHGKFASDGAVTLNAMGGPGTVTAVTAMVEPTTLDGLSLKTTEAPIKLKGTLGERQNWYGAMAIGPDFFSPSHMATDANGDVYGLVYIYDPIPSYRFYRVRAGTRQRDLLPDLHADPMFGGTTMAFAHQAVAFTQNFILFPEMPVGMTPKGTFSFAKVADNYIPTGKVVIHILDKATGTSIASYHGPPFFTWHNINAFENGTHIILDITWQPNSTAGLGAFTTGLVPWQQQGRLARLIMPNPNAVGAKLIGEFSMQFLTPWEGRDGPQGKSVIGADFGVVNPNKMWREPCRYIWAAAVADEDRTVEYWTEIIRVDTKMPDDTVLHYRREGWAVASPVFLPRHESQSADSSEGVLLVLQQNDVGASHMMILDASTLIEIAEISLPIPPTVPGVHNHFSRYPTSV